MSDVTKWLKDRVPGYAALSPEERQAITDFSLLWSLFEHHVLDDQGSAAGIVKECNSLCEPIGSVRECDFSNSLAYFRQRYTDGGAVNDLFGDLCLRRNDHRELVEKVLLDHEATTTAKKLAACLIIVYRYRNNYFHGPKWATQSHGQQDNFDESNKLLVYVLGLLNNW